jgi:hypothetical protein
MLVFDTKDQRSFRVRPHIKGYKPLQAIVEGCIETLPHRLGSDAPFVAYANEEGMISDLPSNFLAWGVLRHLGFLDSTMGMGFYFGNVVLLGKNERALSEKDIDKVRVAQRKYMAEVGVDAKRPPDSELETPPKTKRQKLFH